MTLTEFLRKRKLSAPRNAFIDFPGFETLYVRRGPRVLGNHRRELVLDLAQVEALEPGKGAFTRLLKHIARRYPHYWVFVECVLNERFAAALVTRFGFTQENVGESPCFYLAPKEKP